jgi:hypothetical protein
LVLAGGLIIAAVVLIVRGGPRQAAAETPSEEVG